MKRILSRILSHFKIWSQSHCPHPYPQAHWFRFSMTGVWPPHAIEFKKEFCRVCGKETGMKLA